MVHRRGSALGSPTIGELLSVSEAERCQAAKQLGSDRAVGAALAVTRFARRAMRAAGDRKVAAPTITPENCRTPSDI